MVNRIFEYTPTEESIVVERVLILVHAAIDREFPNAEKAPQRYSKTVFSTDESTALVKSAVPAERDFQRQSTGDANKETVGNTGSFKNNEPTTASLEVPKTENKDKESTTKETPEKTGPSELDEDGFDEDDSKLETQMGAEFTNMYSLDDDKPERSGRDLFLIVLAFGLLCALAAAYWYIFESETIL